MSEEKISVKVLLGVTGSVAAIKVSELVRKLSSLKTVVELSTNDSVEEEGEVEEGEGRKREVEISYELKIVVSERSKEFLTFDEDGKIENTEVVCDEDEWNKWKKIGDPVLHIDLRSWADVMLIAPLTANTLAKMSLGLCDNLLTCVVKAWEYDKKAMMVAPAMNTKMWENVTTSEHIQSIKKKFGVKIIDPISKRLACGDVGCGAMEKVDRMIKFLEDVVSKQLNNM